jgi:hypothetical protein
VSEAQLHNYLQEVVALRRTYALAFLQARQRDVTWTNRSKGPVQARCLHRARMDGGGAVRETRSRWHGSYPHSGSTQLHKM